MDKETRDFVEAVLDELEKQKKFNDRVLKSIDDLRKQQERILEIIAGK